MFSIPDYRNDSIISEGQKIYDLIKDEYDLGVRCGYTDYIDFLTLDEVPKNVMRGIDCFRRKFITLKVGIKDQKTGELRKSAQVFFQRYTDGRGWVGAIFGLNCFLETCGGMKNNQYDIIEDLVNGKTVKLTDAHRYSRGFNSGDIIASMDVWEHKAANLIKRNWLIAFYDPRYRVRKNILNRQFDEYDEELNS